MPKSSRILFALPLVTLFATGPLDAAAVRLDSRVAPVFQAIELKLDASQTDYSGTVRFELLVSEAVESFTLHSEEQELTRLSLRSAGEEIATTWEQGDESILTVTPERRLAPGSYELEIDFDHTFNTQALGLYRMEQEGTGKGYLFTQFEAVDARKAFPCWDEPIYKIPFQMTLEVPDGHVAVSNTPIESEEELDGWRRVVFGKTKPMPSYLLAIASGPFESVEIAGLSVPGRIYAVEGQIGLAGHAASITPTILAALEEWFGTPYPYRKLDFIAIPDYWFGAMENVGAVTFQDTLLLQDPATASVAQRRGQAATIAHELAHMWFGDLVTMKWWNDLWLNESFASWIGDKITETLYPEYRIDLANRRGVQGLMTLDARPSTRPIRREIETMASIFEDLGLAYGKGQTMLGMLEQWIGEETLRRGVLAYLEAHAWGNAEAADLWSALEASSGVDLKPFLSSYLDQPGLPLVTAALTAAGDLELRQRRFLNEGVEARNQLWTLPLRLRLSVEGEIETRTVVLEGETTVVALGGKKVDWVYPDDGAYGYLRWQVEPDIFRQLANAAGDLLSAPERVAFLGNAAALLGAGTISGGDHLAVLRAFADDSEPEVVSTMIGGIDKAADELVPTEGADLFASYLRDSLSPAVDRFGLELAEGEPEAVSLFRPRLFKLLGDTGRDRGVRDRAKELTSAYLADSAAVDPSLAGTALQVAAIEGDGELFETYRERFEASATPIERQHFLGALGYFSTPELQIAALDYNLSGAVRPTELFAIPGSVGRNEAGGDRAFGWLTTSWDDLTPRVPQMILGFMPFFASGCSETRLAAATEFFGNPAHQADGTLANLAKVTEQVTDCVRLRKREGESVLQFLREEPTVAEPDEQRG